MTIETIRRRLLDYARRSEAKAREHRRYVKQAEARGRAQAYKCAAEWLELVEEQASCTP